MVVGVRKMSTIYVLKSRAAEGRGKCGEAARGLLGWQRQGQELAGHTRAPAEE